MISKLKIDKSNKRLISSFSNFFNTNKTDLISVDKNKIIEFKKKLISKKLNGWFSSIEDKTGIEIALINSKKIYEFERVNNFNSNWNFIYGENNNNSYLNFGMKYKICTIENPAILILNEKFKKDIEKFKKRISKDFLPTSVIEIVLYNSIITYFEK